MRWEHDKNVFYTSDATLAINITSVGSLAIVLELEVGRVAFL